MNSLRARLFVVWALSLAAAIALGVLLVQLYSQSQASRLARVDAVASRACERIADRYGFYVTGWSGPTGQQATADSRFRGDLRAVLMLGLGDTPGVRAGIWAGGGGGFLATVPGAGGTGGDGASLLTASERSAIAAAATDAADGGDSASRALTVEGIASIVRACPLAGPVAGMAAWVLVGASDTPGLDRLRAGLGVLMVLVLGIAGWLAWTIADWNRRIGAVERALAPDEAGMLPPVAPTGEPGLDRIVAALNVAGRRLAEARAREAALAGRVALSERLAALGRVAAGMAHEIRNPIAAMRLRAENALQGDPARRGAALEAILAQVARLDRLLAELLEMTQRREPEPEIVAMPDFLAGCAADSGAVATTALDRARFDPALARRVVLELLGNARRHAGPSGRVSLEAERDGGILRFTVADDGPGVDPALRDTLFEPFVTGRPDGTGLGLAIARELAQAQGGTLHLRTARHHMGEGAATAERGAVFALELPWQTF